MINEKLTLKSVISLILRSRNNCIFKKDSSDINASSLAMFANYSFIKTLLNSINQNIILEMIFQLSEQDVYLAFEQEGRLTIEEDVRKRLNRKRLIDIVNTTINEGVRKI